MKDDEFTKAEIVILKYGAKVEMGYWISVAKPRNVEACRSLELRGMGETRLPRRGTGIDLCLNTYGRSIAEMLPKFDFEDSKYFLTK